MYAEGHGLLRTVIHIALLICSPLLRNMCGIWAIFGSEEDVAIQSTNAHKIRYRGPDAFRLETIRQFPNCCLGFHRLSIVDDLCGMQPMRLFEYPNIWLMYNGEIYNHKQIKEDFQFNYSTACDGECIIHLFAKGGIGYAAKNLDGVFAFCLIDTSERKVYLGRDTFGVKPMFRVSTENGCLALCSEAKGITGLAKEEGNIEPFPPAHVETYAIDSNGKATFVERQRFHKIGEAPVYRTTDDINANDIKTSIRTLLEAAVSKRLMSDRRVGCLLSGGLDSSLVAAILVKKAKEIALSYPVQTFSIGMEGSTDLNAARKVAADLNTEHHEIVFSPEDGIAAIDDVIYHSETYDIMAIRSGICNYLLCKYIKENTDTTVILSGEGSDEIAQGYIWFHVAPSSREREEESKRLCENLHYFDVLRVDRVSSAWGLELRVPFLDHKFSSFYLSLDTDLKAPKNGIEKYLLRSAYDGQGLLPDEILWRPKEGFSDGVSSQKRSWYEVLHEHFDTKFGDNELDVARKAYTINPPFSKEALYYRQVFEKHFQGDACARFVPYYWTPKWIQTKDPSSRTLKHYKQ